MTPEQLQCAVRCRNRIEQQKQDISNLEMMIKCRYGVIEGFTKRIVRYITCLGCQIFKKDFYSTEITLDADDLEVLRQYRLEKLRQSESDLEKILKK